MTTPRRLIIAALLGSSLAPMPGQAQSVDLVMPENSAAVAEQIAPLASYPLPLGPFRDGTLPTKPLEGAVQQRAWRIDGSGASTLELLVPLRAQLAAQGFDIVFECEGLQCGGFDFRFATPLLPEPEMHVDLGDFRFLSATRKDEAISLMVSKSAAAGFVQVTHVGQKPAQALGTTAPATPQPAQETVFRQPQPSQGTGDTLASRLLASGAAVLKGLDFPSGSAALPKGSYAALDQMAAWMKANPETSVAVVGHTDASGGLAGNIALSRQRAQAVRQYLIRQHGIDSSRIEAEGVGYLAPIASNQTEEGRQKNRRVEVMVTSTPVQP